MIDAYLFDWGDTLMVDFPGTPGKMCDWKIVQAVDGASEALEFLSESAAVYIATGASESSVADIQRAFNRVGLDQYVSGYFCKSSVGCSKGSPDFLPTILGLLVLPASRTAMVGDSFAKDIEPAMRAGVQPIWLTQEDAPQGTDIRVIRSLRELCI
ncbi:HAD family hydrolase [Marinobacter lutaoensis]|nr:HAD family hydrolase [Marinobacter lutaoensis]